jgi:hypothetical protein
LEFTFVAELPDWRAKQEELEDTDQRRSAGRPGHNVLPPFDRFVRWWTLAFSA